jgi:ELWxxDGT repeat protein
MRLEALEERTLLSLTLIKDINPVPLFPAEITGAGGNVYFVTKAADGASGLNVKSATGVALLKEFPARSSATSDREDVTSLTPIGSKLFFVGDAGQGQQLWVTNGTRAGTRLVKDLNPGGVGDATAVGNELYFTSDVSHGSSSNRLLFESNGTAAGTVPVAMAAGSAKSGNYAAGLVSYGGALYFGFGNQLMKTNGATTKVVGTFGGDLTVAGGVLYFTSPDASQQGEDLYATNGTARGTTLLKDFVNPSGSD